MASASPHPGAIVVMLPESAVLFDHLAPSYEEHFAEVHRQAYDELAWEIVIELLPPPSAVIVDAGCGIGRWADRLLDMGHRVVGLEPAACMANRAARLTTRSGFTLLREAIETARLSECCADVVIAMGSLQYTDEPGAALQRLASWTKDDGVVCVLVDSLNALVVELLRQGDVEGATATLTSRRGEWVVGAYRAHPHLMDAATLTALFEAADLSVQRTAGLLVGATALGRESLQRALTDDYRGQLDIQRRLSQHESLADLGKQLLIIGRKGPSPRR